MSTVPEAQRRYQASEKGRATRRARDTARAATLDGREAKRAKERAWAAANPLRIRDKQLRARYGITLAQWDALLEHQGHRCANCGTDNPGKRRWATDHDHVTGAVRGILCHPCNHLLGQLGDDAAGVRASAARFLRYLGAEPAFDAAGRLIPWEPKE